MPDLTKELLLAAYTQITLGNWSIGDAKEFVDRQGSLRFQESLLDALNRVLNPDFPTIDPEQYRQSLAFPAYQDCHSCSCHINPPCWACTSCPTCEELGPVSDRYLGTSL